MKKAQRKTFIQLTVDLSNIPRINYGGCGLVAKALYEALYKQYPNVSIWYLDDCDNREAYIYNKPYAPNHVVIKVGRYYYDANGVYSPSQLQKHWNFMNKWKVSYQYLIDSIDKGRWNPEFDREDHAPIIYKLIKPYKALL
jgi:hypothetical protein